MAGEVAACGAERQHRGAGQEVVQRLLLDRVDAEPAGASVGGQYDRVVLPGPHEAQAARTLLQPAEAWAHLALHPPVVEHPPMLRRDDRPRRLYGLVARHLDDLLGSGPPLPGNPARSEEHTSALPSLMRLSYA